MPVPWLTVGKLVLGNLDTILNVVRPSFTRKKFDEVADRNALLSQQIAELQAAAASNAEQVTQLATQMKDLVAALAQSAAEVAEERAARRRMTQWALGLAVVAMISAGVALWGVFSSSA